MIDVCELKEYERVSGDTTGIRFVLKNKSDLRGYSIKYSIYNTRKGIVEVLKDRLQEQDNTILVDFECVDTQNLRGTYRQQLEIHGVDKFGKDQHYVLCQGYIKFIGGGICI